MELREYQTAYGTEKFDQVLRQNTSEEEREKYLSALNAFSLEQFGYIFVKKRWETQQNTPWRMPGREVQTVPYAFTGEAGVLRAQGQGTLGLSHGDHAVHLAGTPEELSGQPTLLRSLVENAPQLSFHPETGHIFPAQYACNLNWLATNELLTDKIFALRELPEEMVVAGNGFGAVPY